MSYTKKGLQRKNACVAASTGNIANLGAGAPGIVDGVSLSTGDRVLVWMQTAGAENGIYTVDTVGTGANGSWSRAEDFNLALQDEIRAGVACYVSGARTTGSRTSASRPKAPSPSARRLSCSRRRRAPRRPHAADRDLARPRAACPERWRDVSRLREGLPPLQGLGNGRR